MFEDDAGIDVARALYLDLTGKPAPAALPMRQRTFVAEFHDLAASLGYFRSGKLTLGEWRRSLAGHRELAWLSRDDLLPFAVLCVRLLLRAAEKLRLKRRPKAGTDLPRFVRGRCRPVDPIQPPYGRACCRRGQAMGPLVLCCESREEALR
jgi:hypothetical protein